MKDGTARLHRAGHILALGAYLVLALCYARHVLSTFGGPTIDDAGITYAYADNLAHGRGLRLTPGEAPTEGFSNFLEVLALAPFARAFDLDAVAKVLNVTCSTAGLLLLALFIHGGLRGPSRLFAAVPLLQAFLWPGFNYWTAAGLEGGMLAGLQMASLVALGWGADRALGVTAGLLAWVRPEGFVYGAVALAARWTAGRPGRRRALVIFAGACVLLVATRLIVFRDCVPNTYWAKISAAISRREGLLYVGQFFTHRGWYLLCVFPVLAVLARGPMVLAAAGQLLFAFYFPVHVGGDWMREWRFVQPAMGPLAALGAVGLLAVLTTWPRRVWLAGALLVPSLLIAVVPPGWKVRAQRISVSRNIDLRVLAEVAGHYRQFADDLHLDRRLVHLDVDAGGVSYRSGLDVMDMSGLTDRVLARGWTRESGLIVDYVFGERRPDTIHLHAGWLSGTPVEVMSPFGLLYRPFAPTTLARMRLSAVTAARGDLLDPLVAPVVAATEEVGGASVTGLSAVRTADGYTLFVHARQSRSSNPDPLRWSGQDGRTYAGTWHAGVAVEAGPVGAPVLARALAPAGALPLVLQGTALRVERWPEVELDLTSLAGLSRLSLLRLAGILRPACDPAPLLDPEADGPSRARGVAFIAELCGGLPAEVRRAYADRAWSAARAAGDPDDRYEAAVAGARLGLPQTVAERLFLERARREHQRHDEVLMTWAEHELAAVPPPAVEVGRGLAMLLAARQDGELLLRALAHGWAGLPEAAAPVCGAARRLGLRPRVVGLGCDGIGSAMVVVARQGFEDATDSSLHFGGQSRRWIAAASPPGRERVSGGQGRAFLSSLPENPRELVEGEVVWGPFPLPGRRFGALLGGAASAVVEIEEAGGWTEIWRSSRAPFDKVMTPQVGLLPDRLGRPARVRVARSRPGRGEVLADALTFIDVAR